MTNLNKTIPWFPKLSSLEINPCLSYVQEESKKLKDGTKTGQVYKQSYSAKQISGLWCPLQSAHINAKEKTASEWWGFECKWEYKYNKKNVWAISTPIDWLQAIVPLQNLPKKNQWTPIFFLIGNDKGIYWTPIFLLLRKSMKKSFRPLQKPPWCVVPFLYIYQPPKPNLLKESPISFLSFLLSVYFSSF